MSFLQPFLLIGLPLALLPVLIHLINQHRHRTVRWAAMMFLLDAKKMTKGLARLRQILILTMRVCAILAIIFAASRPLAGGWLGLSGGRADTIVILLDRSASMEQQDLVTGETKRSTALARIADLIETTGGRSEIVLIDSASLTPVEVNTAAALRELPEASPTATAASIPSMLREALDYLEHRGVGRVDLWLASDLRQSDWNPTSGEWQALRSDLAAHERVRLFLLTFPSAEKDNLSISVHEVKRRRTAEGLGLVMDLVIRRHGPEAEKGEAIVPLEITLNGTRTVEELVVSGPELILLGHPLPLSAGNERGWGRLDLPADDNLADNTAYFVFDEPAPRKTVILSDDRVAAEAIRAAAASATEVGTNFEALVLETTAVAQIPWDETALLFWHAAVPPAGSTEAALLTQYVASGRSLVFLPPPDEPGGTWAGFHWGEWSEDPEAIPIEWWRTETGLLENTRSGAPLPVAELAVFRARGFEGEFLPLMKLRDEQTLIARLIPNEAALDGGHAGTVHLWGTLPRADYSTLATEGVVFFVMTHRALEAGAGAVSRARSLEVGQEVLSAYPGLRTLDVVESGKIPIPPGLMPGAWEYGEGEGNQRLIALNRPESEDESRVLSAEALDLIFAGVEYRRIDDEVGSGSSLASEVWRLFLIAMAFALVAEAALCLPPKMEESSDSLRARV